MDTNVNCMGVQKRSEDTDDRKEACESEGVPAKRTRTIMTPEQNNVLMKFFLIDPFPSTEIRKNLAKSLGIRPRTVQIWFQNQRQKAKNRSHGVQRSEIWPTYTNFPIPNKVTRKSSLDVLADVAYEEYCRFHNKKDVFKHKSI